LTQLILNYSYLGKLWDTLGSQLEWLVDHSDSLDECAASKTSEKVKQKLKLYFEVDSTCKDGLVLNQLERSFETEITDKVRSSPM